MTRRIRVSRKVDTKKLHNLTNGPWHGHSIVLDAHGDGNTGWIQLGEHVGRYSGGKWEVQS